MKLHIDHNSRGPSGMSRAGSVLVIVLWVSFGLITVALYFSNSMSFEMRAADNRVAALEADQAIEGAARYTMSLLTNNFAIQPGTMLDPMSYQRESVSVGTATYWFLGRADQQTSTIGSPTRQNITSQNSLNSSEQPSFGLVDEASKLNINASWVTADVLSYLPRMTPELAAAIIDWRDTDSDITQGGAEDETYQRLKPPYLCKNAPYETPEELRLVYGMDMETLYGEDINLNGVLDPNENDGNLTPPNDNRDNRLDAGILSFVTVFTREPNIRTNGSARINVSNLAPQQQQGPPGRGGGGGQQLSQGQQQLASLLQEKGFATDRINTIVRAAGSSTQQSRSVLEFYMRSTMTPEEFAEVATDVTVASGQYIQGLVNINTASEEVLACIPGIGPTNATSVLSYRLSNPDKLTSVAWLAEVLDPASARLAGPCITSQSYQTSADIVAVGHHGRGYRRVRFVFDLSDGTMKTLYRQDLTHLGWALGRNLQQQVLMAKITR